MYRLAKKKTLLLTLCRPENDYSQNPRLVTHVSPKVEGDCEKVRRSYEEFFGSMEREMSRDLTYSIFKRSPFVTTSSLSSRIFEIDDFEHLVFVEYCPCKMNRDCVTFVIEDS